MTNELAFWSYVQQNKELVFTLVRFTRFSMIEQKPKPLADLWEIAHFHRMDYHSATSWRPRKEFVAPMSRLIVCLDPELYGVFERRDAACDVWQWPATTGDAWRWMERGAPQIIERVTP